MKAIIYRQYGSPDVLKCEETEKPVPGESQVLIKVRAAALNPLDWHFMRGTPYPLRMMTGLRKPKNGRLGVDVAGQVEAVGRNVTRFKAGDEVFGSCRGAVAEYAVASESGLVGKPDNVTFEQAAAVAVAAITALQGLRDKGGIQPGQRVLINGAAGGVGTFAVQIARSFGADVTGVCSTGNVEMVLSMGAHRVIDYTRDDFTKGGQRYDLLFDCIGNHSLSACRRILQPKGVFVPVGGTDNRWMTGTIAGLIKAFVLSRFVSQRLVVFFLANLNKDDLTFIQGLLAAGRIVPVIDKRYRLDQVPEAIRYLESGHVRGKLVVTPE